MTVLGRWPLAIIFMFVVIELFDQIYPYREVVVEFLVLIAAIVVLVVVFPNWIGRTQHKFVRRGARRAFKTSGVPR
jgi:hypothetical protein